MSVLINIFIALCTILQLNGSMVLTSDDCTIGPHEEEVLLQIILEQLRPMMPVPLHLSPKLPVLDEIKSVIFDVYGTLLISGSGDVGTIRKGENGNLLCRALVSAGFVIKNDTACEYALSAVQRCISSHHSVLKLQGVPFPEVDILEIYSEVIDDLLHRNMISGKPVRMALLKLAVSYEILSNPLWPMPGCKETIAKLKETHVLGIISNAQFYTPLMFKALIKQDIRGNCFREDLIYYSYQSKRAKPSPFMFDKMKKQLYNRYGIGGNEVLYVGNDMRNDVGAAHTAGFRTALFAGDARSLRLREDDDTNSIPDVILTDLRQLKEVLQ